MFSSGFPQTESVPAEVGIVPVCRAKDRLHHTINHPLDQWQLRHRRCECGVSTHTQTKLGFKRREHILNTNIPNTVCVFQMAITGAAIWINPGVGVLTIIALWPVAIMFMHLRITLRSLKIIPKYAMYQVRLHSCHVNEPI